MLISIKKQEELLLHLWVNCVFIFLLLCNFLSVNTLCVIEIFLFLSLPFISYKVSNNAMLSKQFIKIVFFILIIWSLALSCFVSQLFLEKVVAIIGNIVLFVSILFLVKKINMKKYLESSIYIIKDKWILYICFVIFVIFTLSTINEFPVWDSRLYYDIFIKKLALNFHYSFSNISDYEFWSHLSHGYGLICLIPELISPQHVQGVHIINIFLLLIAANSFYEILDYVFRDGKKIFKLVGTMIFLFSPFNLGAIGFINTDTPAVWLFIIMTNVYLKKETVMELVIAYMFVFTKEPSVIYYAGFLLAVLICNKNLINVIYKGIIGIYWFITYLCINNYISLLKGSLLVYDNNSLGVFKIDKWNIFAKTVQIFSMNFNWLVCVFCLILISFVIKRKDMQFTAKNSRYVEYNILLLVTLAAIVVLNISFFDFINPRYIQLGSIIVILLFAGLINYSVMYIQEKFLLFISGVIFISFVVQSFMSVDIVTYGLLRKEPNYGKSLIACSMFGAMGDQMVYNRDYAYYIKAVEKVMEENDFDESTALTFVQDTLFIRYDEYPEYDYEPVYWNVNKKRFSTYYDDNMIEVKLSENEQGVKKVIEIGNLEDITDNKKICSYGPITVAYTVRYIE